MRGVADASSRAWGCARFHADAAPRRGGRCRRLLQLQLQSKHTHALPPARLPHALQGLRGTGWPKDMRLCRQHPPARQSQCIRPLTDVIGGCDLHALRQAVRACPAAAAARPAWRSTRDVRRAQRAAGGQQRRRRAARAVLHASVKHAHCWLPMRVRIEIMQPRCAEGGLVEILTRVEASGRTPKNSGCK
jgi:hypothetical protein